MFLWAVGLGGGGGGGVTDNLGSPANINHHVSLSTTQTGLSTRSSFLESVFNSPHRQQTPNTAGNINTHRIILPRSSLAKFVSMSDGSLNACLFRERAGRGGRGVEDERKDLHGKKHIQTQTHPQAEIRNTDGI